MLLTLHPHHRFALCPLSRVGADPAQNAPQGLAATTHVEEVGRAVTGVHDAGHLHALTTALPGLSLVLEALREAGRGLSPSGHCGGGCGGRGARALTRGQEVLQIWVSQLIEKVSDGAPPGSSHQHFSHRLEETTAPGCRSQG